MISWGSLDSICFLKGLIRLHSIRGSHQIPKGIPSILEEIDSTSSRKPLESSGPQGEFLDAEGGVLKSLRDSLESFEEPSYLLKQIPYVIKATFESFR